MANTAPRDPQPGGEPLLFDAVLMPHRSLSRAGFRVLMMLVAALSTILGLVFYLIGAWPIVGLLGLDVALVWLAFRLSYRSGRLRETLELSTASLTVRRTLPSGRAREWRFQPYWLRVEVDRPQAPDGRLTLASHGRRLTIGAFLTPGERISLAAALARALARLHCRPEPLIQT